MARLNNDVYLDDASLVVVERNRAQSRPVHRLLRMCQLLRKDE
jgi:hypothetical protein